MNNLLNIVLVLIAVIGSVTLFIGAYGGVLNPENPVLFYSLVGFFSYASLVWVILND